MMLVGFAAFSFALPEATWTFLAQLYSAKTHLSDPNPSYFLSSLVCFTCGWKKSTALKEVPQEVGNGGREELQVSAPPEEGWWGDLLCSLARHSPTPGRLKEKTFPVPSMRTSVGQKCLEWTQRGQLQMEFLTCFIPAVPVCDSPEWCPGTATRMWAGIYTGPFSLFSREAALSQLSQCSLSYCSLALPHQNSISEPRF